MAYIIKILDRNTPEQDLQRYLFDVSELIKTVNKSLEGTELDHTLRTRTPEELMGRLQDSRRAFIVVATPYESPDQITGCYLVTGALSSSQHPKLRHIGWSGGLARHPNYQGTGIGDLLLGTSLEEVKRRELTELVTETEEQNVRALRLLKRFGYTEGVPYVWAIWDPYKSRILKISNSGNILRYEWTTPENRQTTVIPLHKKL